MRCYGDIHRTNQMLAPEEVFLEIDEEELEEYKKKGWELVGD